MATIKIRQLEVENTKESSRQLKGGGETQEIVTTKQIKPACSGYFYDDDKKILPGQTAEVPDEDLQKHLETGLIELVK